MKTIVVAALLALSFTTGFTCSKNQPAETPAQETMAAPEATPAVEATPADGAAPATETAPADGAAPAETK